MTLVIAEEDPRTPDVRALLEAHLEFSRAETPAEFVFALDLEGLLDPAVTFFAARRDGALVGVGALKRLGAQEAELKSMHTSRAARRQGVGRAMVERLVAEARAGGVRRLRLETGTEAAYAPARALYRSLGFVPCGPFGSYRATPHNTFMVLVLAPEEPGAADER